MVIKKNIIDWREASPRMIVWRLVLCSRIDLPENGIDKNGDLISNYLGPCETTKIMTRMTVLGMASRNTSCRAMDC